VSSYATPNDLGIYGLSSSVVEELDPSDVQEKLDAASSTADGYLSTHYTLPIVVPYPASLIDAVCRIAAYNLLSVRGYNPEGQAEQIRLRYEDAIRWLEGISAGRIAPGDIIDSTGRGDEGGPFVVQPQASSTSSTGSTFGTPRSRGW
jgi:phage gp36-like protein